MSLISHSGGPNWIYYILFRHPHNMGTLVHMVSIPSRFLAVSFKYDPSSNQSWMFCGRDVFPDWISKNRNFPMCNSFPQQVMCKLENQLARNESMAKWMKGVESWKGWFKSLILGIRAHLYHVDCWWWYEILVFKRAYDNAAIENTHHHRYPRLMAAPFLT